MESDVLVVFFKKDNEKLQLCLKYSLIHYVSNGQVTTVKRLQTVFYGKGKKVHDKNNRTLFCNRRRFTSHPRRFLSSKNIECGVQVIKLR